MADLEEIPKTYEEAGECLARWHAIGEHGPERIYAFPDPETQVVRLVEVSPSAPETGEITPVGFGRSPDFPFRSSVIVVTPNEWDQVRSGELKLPQDWALESMRQVWPS